MLASSHQLCPNIPVSRQESKRPSQEEFQQDDINQYSASPQQSSPTQAKLPRSLSSLPKFPPTTSQKQVPKNGLLKAYKE
ncbi:hypothetical protein DSO57_1026164 [Entomophthora muscae]|uniref:Uncharacterized protein n=1 Tax=Entomophthora muscae TaxID=34485 RepID=A0ACC2ULZ9_9FUNG|nr:hypothetical protein DSO57_1026164 [Entomophthora muscae]